MANKDSEKNFARKHIIYQVNGTYSLNVIQYGVCESSSKGCDPLVMIIFLATTCDNNCLTAKIELFFATAVIRQLLVITTLC